MMAALRAAAAPPAVFETARFELERCLARHGGAEAVELAAQCPGLARALETGEGAAHLPPVGDAPQRATLEKLHRLLYAASGPGGGPARSMDYASLEGILAEVHQPVAQPPPGLWERFMRWLGGLLDDNADAAYLEPLKRFFEWIDRHVPVGRIARLLFQGALVTLLILAVGLLIHQLVTARGLPRLPERGGRKAAGRAAASVAGPSLADIRRLPPARQPAALLVWCIDALTRRDVLPGGRSRTNRELLDCLRGDPATRGAFARLVETAEPCIYGGRPADAGRLDTLYRNAATLAGERGGKD